LFSKIPIASSDFPFAPIATSALSDKQRNKMLIFEQVGKSILSSNAVFKILSDSDNVCVAGNGGQN